MVSFADIERAASVLEGKVHRTPVLTSRRLNELLGAEVFIKAENFQKTGAFKFRGATYAISQLTDEQKKCGVLTFSSGNHAQALARAGQLAGVPITVVMPHDAPEIKRKATEGYGGKVVLYDRDEENREALGREIAEREGLTLIPPYDHPHIVAGQGTAALELHQGIPGLEMVLAPIGGGGLMSGTCLATKALATDCELYGVEPEAGDDVARSFRSGVLESVKNPQSIADGALTPSASDLTFGIIKQHCTGVLTASDAELVEAMKLYFSMLKIVVEPTGCLSLAPLLAGKLDGKGKRIGVIVSGGNVDVARFAELVC
ncbi:MAG: threo-3-hydroxy-L-aspartate ammonia-lyase [Armatimonadetes bacterium]|nr:threo-3-hydroxy-L-aspartate ammonia-lyase [Armatimonadota bacterium]